MGSTNTDSNILPCKVLEVKKVTDSKSVYKIFSKGGILKSYYWDEDLVDLRTVYFPGLNSNTFEYNFGFSFLFITTFGQSLFVSFAWARYLRFVAWTLHCITFFLK
jgi:hypothetical protein